jgi:hypothetical protein
VQGDRGADFAQTAAYLARHKSISKKAGKVKRKTRLLIFSLSFRTFKVRNFEATISKKE